MTQRSAKVNGVHETRGTPRRLNSDAILRVMRATVDSFSSSQVAATVNGRSVVEDVEPGLTLLGFLRDGLRLTAAKEGCGQGDCGSCIVLVDGEPVNACLVLAAEVDGGTVVTLEGVAQDDRLHPLQEEFCERWGFQCGYCTPGMVMSCLALLMKNSEPDEADVREAIEGNLCRCTNYRAIVDATLAAAERCRTHRGSD